MKNSLEISEKLTLGHHPIGLGLAALGRPGYINLGHREDLQHEYDVEAMQAGAHKVLDAVYAAGVRYFDAARSYGLAEQFLGSWLRQRGLSPTDVIVGSKWGYTYTAEWQIEAQEHEVKEHSLAVLERQWGESKDALGEYLQLYQIHSATFESGVLENSSVLEELARRKADGVAVGLSVSGAEQGQVIERALSVEVDGVPLFDAVQATWNVLECSATSALKTAHNAGLAVIVKEALANGRLTSRNPDPAQRGILETQAHRLHTTVDALALAYVLAQEWGTVVLSGAANINHAQSNLAATDVALDTEAMQVLSGMTESAEGYWQKRTNLAWN